MMVAAVMASDMYSHVIITIVILMVVIIIIVIILTLLLSPYTALTSSFITPCLTLETA